jgi:hypothetical protein
MHAHAETWRSLGDFWEMLEYSLAVMNRSIVMDLRENAKRNDGEWVSADSYIDVEGDCRI